MDEVSSEVPKASKAKEFAKKYAGTGVIGSMLMFMMTYVDGKIEAVERNMNEKQVMVTSYVDIRHDEVKEDLKEIKMILEKIDARIYQMKGEKQ